MKGKEHYEEAERLLAEVYAKPADISNFPDITMCALAAAQAHATLALTMATLVVLEREDWE